MADSTHPLSETERHTLVRAFGLYPADLDGQLTHVLFSTGMHPTCLGNPKRWRMNLSDGILTWNRAKTDQMVSVPVDPAIANYLPDLLNALEERPMHPVNVAKAVKRFGEKSGVFGLTPRTLRHDFAFRAVEARGPVDARELTGTTTDVLMSYARREIAKAVAKDPKGLFG